MRHWSFNRRIALASLTVVVALAIMAAAAVAGFVLIERSVEGYHDGFDNAQSVSQLQLKLKDVRLMESDAILESDTDLLSTYPKRTADIFKDMENDISRIASRSEGATQAQVVENIKNTINKRKDYSDQILRAAVAGDADKALELFDFANTESQDLEESIKTALSDLTAHGASQRAALKKELNGNLRNWMYLVLLLSLACVSIVPSIVHSNMSFIRRNMARSIDNLLDSAEKIEPIIQKLGTFGSKFKRGREAGQIAREKSGNAIQMLAESLIQHADSTGKAADFVAENAEKIQKSQVSAVIVVDAFAGAQGNTDALVDKVESYAARIEDALRAIENLSEKTKIINDFIFQTKIISFNAAVEAARAGDAGRGFSIVAEELAHLSQSSGQSAKDFTSALEIGLAGIETLLRESREDFKLLLSNNREVIERGSNAALHCTESIESLSKISQNLSQLIGDTGQALRAQLESFASVSDSLKSLNDSASTEESLAGGYTQSMQELAEQSDNLRGLARNLANVMKGSGNSTARLRMNDNSGTQEIEESAILSPVEQQEVSVTAPKTTRDSEQRRKRTKSIAQRRHRERLPDASADTHLLPDERPMRRKA